MFIMVFNTYIFPKSSFISSSLFSIMCTTTYTTDLRGFTTHKKDYSNSWPVSLQRLKFYAICILMRMLLRADVIPRMNTQRDKKKKRKVK